MPGTAQRFEDGAGKDSPTLCPQDAFSLVNLLGGAHAFPSRKLSISYMGFSIQKAQRPQMGSQEQDPVHMGFVCPTKCF